ncbi:PREDICTED: alpha-protein kinase 3 [Nanorana parkeri]|uniref:alpha-protein kinase 3 n=1 Tax=Nanorana parkeri TaxID=125878 RepID=UPI000854489F|nr:PREDICTED: alpha-protein kinase 3 [Nanorana parkeri]
MGTRRPMTRTPSGNGRYYDSHGSSNGSTSDSEDSNGSVYNPRADSRSYLLNVRPENSRSSVSRYAHYTSGRTTFCNIISQLTEETQPCFETTLKARAVSEGSDAKFICMVSGYPEPEVTWYKDDEELDRYCGLPKYEIFRNGKRHTLQIYKCSEEDAAIYQASARNNKGIVSCSGVLEVGTMSEYKIHQRWFAKLKRKAEAKMREIEQSRRRVKENFEEGERLRALSPERIQRKRRFSSEKKEDALASSEDKEELIKVHIPDPNSRLQGEIPKTVEQPQNVVNGFAEMDTKPKEEVTTNGYSLPENIEENGKEFLAYVYETVEVITKKQASKESYARKKKKEDEPLQIPDSKKEEAVQGSPNQVEGISSATRRSRFGRDTPKSPVQEKMEVEISPVTTNKRFAASTAPNKTGKSVVAKDTMKLKDGLVCHSRADESSIPKPVNLQTEGDIMFSLKDMYFDDLTQHTNEEKSPTTFLKDQKTKGDMQTPSVTHAKPSIEGQNKEMPKAAPRRSKEQRELSAGRRTSPKPSKKSETPAPGRVSNICQTLPEVKLKSELPKLPAVERNSDSSVSVPVSYFTEQKVKEIKSTDQVYPVKVPDKVSSDVASAHGNKSISTNIEEVGRKPHEEQPLENNRMSTDNSNEEKTRTETLQKLQNLEVEYMALQKAYALLQQELELSQNAEEMRAEAMKAEAMKAEEQRAEAQKAETQKSEAKNSETQKPEAQRAEEVKEETQREKDMKAEAQMAEAMEVETQKAEAQTPQSEKAKAQKAKEKQAVERDKGPLNITVLPTEKSTGLSEAAGTWSNEVEMIEEEEKKLKAQQLLDGTSGGFSTATTNITEQVNKTSKLPSQEHVAETAENILDANPPVDSSTKLLPCDQNQSVVTLLRDVKKALDSAVTTKEESSVDPMALKAPEQAEDHYKDDLMQPLPQNVRHDKESEQFVTKSSTFKEKVPKTDLPPSEPLSIHLEQELVQENASKHQNKQDHSLVTTLKNSLLMLFHMKTTDTEEHKVETKSQRNLAESHQESSGDIYSPERSPPSSQNVYESSKESDSPQSPESMHSASTSGKLTPSSEEDMVHSADSLPTSPTIPRRISDFSRKGEIAQVESAPLSPAIPKRSSKGICEETFLTKEDLSFSPSTSRKIAAKIASASNSIAALSVPSIVVGSLCSEKTPGDMLYESQRDSNRKWKSSENLSAIPSATPQELASGARRKIYLPKSKQLDDENDGNKGSLTPPSKRESPNVSPGLSRKSSSLLVSQSPPVERRSPGTTRRMPMLDVPKICEETVDEKNSTDYSSQETKDSSVLPKEEPQITEIKKVKDPYKAPQVIRKIRAEQFSDASGNLKLWCQFFNILSDSDITWYKDEVQVAKVKRCSGDEGQVALAIVQASVKDCGVYQCTIENEYGTDSTDCLLSAEILAGFISREDVEVGEEIEMTPMVFAKGLADSGYWGDKFFGRIAMEEPHAGKGFSRKSCRVKVIYGLEPMFESGKTCIIKIRNLITFGTKNENTLVEKNYDITIQECKIQNTTREYCKIFAAECRGVPNFGQILEILPLNLIYRPANNIPYATIEDDLQGAFEKYCVRDITGKLHFKNSSEIERKCCTFQHWVYQWTNGNFLVTTLEGVEWKLTNIAIATKSRGYQGLKESCYPEILEEFPSIHQCNNYCEMLSLKSLKTMESLQPPAKPKGSRSPQMQRKSGSGSAQSSPQIQKKTLTVAQNNKKGGVSPKSPRKSMETGEPQPGAKNKGNDMKLQ